MKPSAELSADSQGSRPNRAAREPILGDNSLLVLCAFLAALLQFWQQGFYSCTC